MGDTYISEIAGRIIDRVSSSLSAQQAQNCEGSISFLAAVKNELREVIQRMTQKQVRPIIEKLKRRESLTQAELNVVRIWVVGDAYAYSSTENNLQDWIAEARRILSEIEKYRSIPEEPEHVMTLQALVEDLNQNLQDINRVSRDLERVARFTESTQQIDATEAQTLATILERKLLSGSM